MSRLHICISENRPQDAVGVKLLVLSLARHQPDAILHLFVDGLEPDVRTFLKRIPNVQLEHLALSPELGWNIKAKIFSALFADGLNEAIWIDSDIILTAPIGHFFAGLPAGRLVLAEEFFTFRNRGVLVRTRGWGLETGRELPFTPNSCVMRMTRAHLPFIEAWQELLDRPDYRALQAMPWQSRPFYMMGDQDAMAALLGSKSFMDLDVGMLRRGTDIAQCFKADGYSPAERLCNRSRLPPFIHAQGGKPWRLSAKDETYHYVSPYWYAARAYRQDLQSDEAVWLDNRPLAAWLLHCLASGNPSLAGFFPALVHQARKYAGGALRRLKG